MGRGPRRVQNPSKPRFEPPSIDLLRSLKRGETSPELFHERTGYSLSQAYRIKANPDTHILRRAVADAVWKGVEELLARRSDFFFVPGLLRAEQRKLPAVITWEQEACEHLHKRWNVLAKGSPAQDKKHIPSKATFNRIVPKTKRKRTKKFLKNNGITTGQTVALARSQSRW